jgi:hypothetical protein
MKSFTYKHPYHPKSFEFDVGDRWIEEDCLEFHATRNEEWFDTETQDFIFIELPRETIRQIRDYLTEMLEKEPPCPSFP